MKKFLFFRQNQSSSIGI